LVVSEQLDAKLLSTIIFAGHFQCPR
jgi:hypothetical protein